MAELEAANARLKAGKIRCSIQLRGRSYALVATLPTRDGSARKQQRIALGEIDLFEAERRAVALGHQLRDGSFSWDAWDAAQAPSAEGISATAFRETARRLYEKRFTSESSWQKKWRPALNKLPENGVITEATILRIIRRMPEGSAGRRDTANVLAQACRAAGISPEAVQAAGRGYTAANLSPRDIPSDEVIEDYFEQIKLPHWRWVYGMCATYGTRPHELVEAEIDADGNCIISDDTKTGHHIAWPVHERWLQRFQLRDLPRPPQGKETLAKVANDYLHDRGPLPWGLYTLRHAYAIRLITKGIPADIGCQLMGHSLEIHTRTYRRWLQAKTLSGLRGQFNL